MIIWLASYPRSGNTLARLALFSIFGRQSGSVYPGATASTPDAGRLVIRSLVDRRPLETLAALEEPVFVKTHELECADDDRPALVVVRDGRDALVSFAHFRRDVRAEEGEFERLLEDLVRGPGGPMGTWSESVEAWRRRSPPTALVRYEDLKAAPASILRDAAEEVGVELGTPRGEIPAFADLKQEESAIFRRGSVGSWREEMPAQVEGLFWDRHGATMESLGYER